MLKRIGEHRLFCGDVARGALIALTGGERADLVYTEPPASLREVKVFRSSKQPAGSSWSAFVSALADGIAGHSAGPAFIQAPASVMNDWASAMERRGYRTHARYELVVARRSVVTELWYGSRLEHDAVIPPPVDSTEAAASFVFSNMAHPGMTVLDPCVGLKAATVRAALRCRLIVWASDINAAAIAAAKGLLEASGASQ